LLISTIGAGSRAEWHVFLVQGAAGQSNVLFVFEQGLNITRLLPWCKQPKVLPVQAAEMAFGRQAAM